MCVLSISGATRASERRQIFEADAGSTTRSADRNVKKNSLQVLSVLLMLMTSPGTEEKAGPEYLRGRKTFGDKNFLELLHIIKTLNLFTTCIRIRHSIAFTKFSTVIAQPNLPLEIKTLGLLIKSTGTNINPTSKLLEENVRYIMQWAGSW